MNKIGESNVKILLLPGVIIVGVLLFAIIGYPLMKPWWAQQSGKAELAQAEQNRQIAILEANAKKESAKLLAEAEVERAKGIAQANKIIGDSLKGNEDYLRYLWIDAINSKDHQVIYVPTEGGLPILEAGKR